MNFNDDIKSYVSRHEVRREQKLKTMVNTSVKHYVAALGQHLGNDPCITLSDLDRLSPTINVNIETELSERYPKGKSSQDKNSSQAISLNESFVEIQNSLVSKSSYPMHVARDPAAQIQSAQRQRIETASALAPIPNGTANQSTSPTSSGPPAPPLNDIDQMKDSSRS